MDALFSGHKEDSSSISDSVFYDVFAANAISGRMVHMVESFSNEQVTSGDLHTFVISSAFSLRGFTRFVRARCRQFEDHLVRIDPTGPLELYSAFFSKLRKGTLAHEQPQGTFIRNCFAHGDFELALNDRRLRFFSSSGDISIDPLDFFNEVCPQIFRYYKLLYFVKSGSKVLPEALRRFV